MAVAELAEEGVHLFALFHAVRLLALEGAPSRLPTLLEDARDWYQGLGKEKFVLFLEDPWPGVADTGLVDLGAADTTVLSADLLPDQLEHIWEITAPRAPPRPRRPRGRRPMTDLAERLDLMSRATGDSDVWHPELLDAAAVRAGVIERLLDAELVQAVHDTLEDQLCELMEIRNPTEEDPEAPSWRRALAFLPLEARRATGSGSTTRGPCSWSTAPAEGAYREVRLSRNRNKITPREQARLGTLTIGVAGLSVGQASAIALAMEGIGGPSASRTSTASRSPTSTGSAVGSRDLGVNKARLAARALFEIDPYLEVEIFPEGITAENYEGFLDGLDLLIEECDDLYMKLRLREGARARRIPVVMDTNDRGLLDVERFDLEPERPILHGLVGDLEAAPSSGLSTEDKVPYVLDIVGGADAVSPRLAASMVEIGNTLNTWPQLASDVLLGRRLCADVARRIALGGISRLGALLRRARAAGRRRPERSMTPAEPEAGARDRGPRRRRRWRRRAARARPGALAALAGCGVLAPSGGQLPALAARGPGRPDPLPSTTWPAPRASSTSSTAPATWPSGPWRRTCAIAASQHGAGGGGRAPSREAGDPTVVCDLELQPRRPGCAPDPLLSVLADRATNRRLGTRVPLEPAARGGAPEAAAARGRYASTSSRSRRRCGG